MVDINLTLPADRSENGPGKINEDVNVLKAAIAKTADLSTANFTDIQALLTTLVARVTAQGNDITVLKGGTVTQPTGGSDVTVTSVSLTPANPVEGDNVTFTAVVKNVGTQPTDALVPVIVTFVVDDVPTLVSRSTAYSVSIPVGASVTLSAAGGASAGNAYKAVKGNHKVVATVNDNSNGGYANGAASNDSLSLNFSVGGISSGGPSTGDTPTGYDSNGLSWSTVTLGAATLASGTAATLSATLFADPTRAAVSLDYGFSIRQVSESGTVISPDTGDLDVATTFTDSSATWTNSRKTLTGSRVFPAGRYAATPFYKLAGTSTYVKANTLTKYFVVAADASDPGTSAPGSNTTGKWLSGSSGEMTANGKFGTWRGRPDDIAATWRGMFGGSSLPVLDAGDEYGAWTKDLVIAVPGKANNQTWAQAASGATDQNWTDFLNELKTKWTRIQRGTPWVVFGWEWNGDWFDWSVRNTADQANFVTAFKRFRALQKSIFPAAKLGTIVNKDSKYGLDWRKAIPGYLDGTKASSWMDFGGVDWYNNYDVITNASQVQAQFNALGPVGEPYGLETHRKFWEDQGVPLIVQEWGNNALFGDNPPYIQAMFDFFKKNGGTGAGNVVAEIYFNTLVPEQDYKFFLYNDGRATRNPLSAALYKQLWPTASKP
jgi:hypothetical protein